MIVNIYSAPEMSEMMTLLYALDKWENRIGTDRIHILLGKTVMTLDEIKGLCSPN